MRTLLVATAGLLFSGFVLQAQDWQQISGLKPGQMIRVATDSKEETGAFLSVSETGISLDAKDGQVSVDRARVRKVRVRSSGRRLRNTIIGAGVGLAIGITIDQTLGVRLRNEGNETGRFAMIAAPIGVGAAAGALPAAWTTVYKRD